MRKIMEITIYNPQKGRLETINIEFTDENTTWFDAYESGDIHMVTDFDGSLLIGKFGYYHPVLIYGVSRMDIDYDRHRAKKLIFTHDD